LAFLAEFVEGVLGSHLRFPSFAGFLNLLELTLYFNSQMQAKEYIVF